MSATSPTTSPSHMRSPLSPVPSTKGNEVPGSAPAKVVVRFRATGSAPILKQTFYKITAAQKFQTVINFLRKELKYKSQDPLFLYVNSAFSPAPDEIVGNLFKCFGTDGNLIINYSTTAAWG
ncbi:ubiquitin-like autophagy protein Apg12-domain-containing protein [Phlyctochytrium arcticum]|nr:ubiquitin-like autophagy protein Apg12-domain-containing protein [Phlyctochytrium arcticum]